MAGTASTGHSRFPRIPYFSEEFVRLLTRKERDSLAWREVQRHRGTKRYYELTGAQVVVLQAALTGSGLGIEACRGCGQSWTLTPDGTLTTVIVSRDQRFPGSAVLDSMEVQTPGGLISTVSASRTVALGDPNNPLTLVSQVDSLVVNDRTFFNVFDAVGRTFTATTPQGRTSSEVVDSLGRVIAETVPGVDTVRYSYDARGRLSEITQGGRQWRYAYDTQGRLDSVIDPLLRTTTLPCDGADRVAQQVLPDGRVVGYAYDSTGNLTGVTPPGRPAHTFGYSSVDLTESYNPPVVAEGATPTNYEYNLDRELTQILRPDGDTVAFSYDGAGRVQSVTHQDGTLIYGYAASTGNVASVTAGGEAMSFTYDGSLLTGVGWTGSVAGSVTAGYDDDFRVQDLSINGSLLAFFGYDADGLLTQAGDLVIDRDAQNGRIDSTSLGVVTTGESYDGFGQRSTRTAAVSGSEVYRAAYTRDALGRITGLLEVVEGDTTAFTYGYDLAGRLEEVQTDGVVTASYVYDNNGNRLSVTRPSGVETGTYDAQDRLLSYGTATYGYTRAGELRFKAEGSDTTFYHYDALGNLLGVNLPDGTDIEYVVDGFNRRVGKRVNGALVQGFLYQDQLNPVAELDSNGTVVKQFVYGTRANVPDYIVTDSATYRIVADHLGSVRLVVDAATGAVAQRINYDAFGRVLLNTNPEFQPFGYAGGLIEGQGRLVRFGARDYDPLVGRWTAKDPILFAAGPNLFVYVGGDPVNLADPRGLCPPSLTGAPCTPGGVTYLRPVSNRTIRSALELIARRTQSHVTVHSGDRGFNPTGSNNRSEHRMDLGGRGAADFHLYDECGERIAGDEAVRRIFYGGLNPNGGLPTGTRLIQHGPGTNTEGQHLHLDTRTDIGNRYETGGVYTQPHVDGGLWPRR